MSLLTELDMIFNPRAINITSLTGLALLIFCTKLGKGGNKALTTQRGAHNTEWQSQRGVAITTRSQANASNQHLQIFNTSKSKESKKEKIIEPIPITFVIRLRAACVRGAGNKRGGCDYLIKRVQSSRLFIRI